MLTDPGCIADKDLYRRIIILKNLNVKTLIKIENKLDQPLLII
jgi:hypothetical protein